MMTFPFLEALASNHGLPLAEALFVWLFEVGNEFRDVRQLVEGVWHIRRRL
jgi:hypothetical protein